MPWSYHPFKVSFGSERLWAMNSHVLFTGTESQVTILKSTDLALEGSHSVIQMVPAFGVKVTTVLLSWHPFRSQFCYHYLRMANAWFHQVRDWQRQSVACVGKSASSSGYSSLRSRAPSQLVLGWGEAAHHFGHRAGYLAQAGPIKLLWWLVQEWAYNSNWTSQSSFLGFFSQMLREKSSLMLSVVVHTWNSNSLGTEAGGFVIQG